MEALQEKVAEYIAELKQQSVSDNTVVSYKRDLKQLADYFAAQGSTCWRFVSKPQLEAYLRQMEKEKKRPATRSRAIASMKAFFRYLEQSGEIERSPAGQIKSPRIEKEVPHILTPEETVQLLMQPDGTSAKSIRDRAMLELLYATGIRVSELLQLEVEDVNLTMDYILCRHGGKERVVPFGHAAKKSLQEYLNTARPALVKEADSRQLFTNLSGRKMSRQGFWKLIKQYAQAAGIQGEITPHTLRHSFAAHLVNNGADLYAVQEMMGYADLSAAQIYAKMRHASVREVYKKAHPRD